MYSAGPEAAPKEELEWMRCVLQVHQKWDFPGFRQGLVSFLRFNEDICGFVFLSLVCLYVKLFYQCVFNSYSPGGRG